MVALGKTVTLLLPSVSGESLSPEDSARKTATIPKFPSKVYAHKFLLLLNPQCEAVRGEAFGRLHPEQFDPQSFTPAPGSSAKALRP